ncbi:MAG TPA: polyhydroxyalkanoate depolymerase [Rickettsiales bacterium]|nr:polyhydroxyalkanoate depolymerase [Rickettsiales bacterium]
MFPILDNRYLYLAVNNWYNAMKGPSTFFKFAADQWDEKVTPPLSQLLEQDNVLTALLRRSTAARFRLLQRLTQSYRKPAFGISQVEVDEKTVAVHEETVFETPFCKLLHFRKETSKHMPRLLMIAPMAGHYATLLRDTVRDALPCFDVYVTDWVNARDVPISHGGFDMDSYIATLVRCFEYLAPDFHILAVCQAGVPAYAAVSLLEDRKDVHELLPTSMTLMGCPINVRCSPTSVNNFAAKYDEDWFEHMTLSIVPAGYPGERRLVYPGFMQLTAFLSMNPERHQQSIANAIEHYIEGNFEGEEKISSFYAEYCAVMDLTAEFYLQTVRVVFQEALLPQGKMVSRGKLVDPKAIRKTAVFAIEGERDDICGIGQTKAALDLATNLSDSKKEYLLLKDAGHYGIFNGHRFREEVLPAMQAFIARAQNRTSVNIRKMENA